MPVSTQSGYFDWSIAPVKRFALGHHVLLSFREAINGKERYESSLPNRESRASSDRYELGCGYARPLRFLHLRRPEQIAGGKRCGIGDAGIARHHGGDDGVVDNKYPLMSETFSLNRAHL